MKKNKSPEERERINKNKQMSDSLRKRSPEEWRSLVLQVPSDIRAYVARLIWWDWFANRPVPDRWPHLDEFLNVPYSQLMWERANPELVKEPDSNEIFHILLAMGYPESTAIQRI